jgi:undecaprenyl diphosphate synthase
VRLLVSGEVDLLPEQPRRVLHEAMAYLDGGKGLILNLALAYGGRQEIVRAARLAARRVAAGELDAGALDEDDLRQGLYHPELPDPDLIIRTSGEYRLSNFLVWQAAYAELYITGVLWPDFRERHLMLAVDDYLRRERRFGAVSPGEREGSGEPARDVWDAERWKKLLKVRP